MYIRRITLKTARKQRGSISRAAIRKAVAAVYGNPDTSPAQTVHFSKLSKNRKNSHNFVSVK